MQYGGSIDFRVSTPGWWGFATNLGLVMYLLSVLIPFLLVLAHLWRDSAKVSALFNVLFFGLVVVYSSIVWRVDSLSYEVAPLGSLFGVIILVVFVLTLTLGQQPQLMTGLGLMSHEVYLALGISSAPLLLLMVDFTALLLGLEVLTCAIVGALLSSSVAYPDRQLQPVI